MKHITSVPLSLHELYTLHQALNEVCHGIEVPEFSTRMGATKQEAMALMQKLGGLIENYKSSNQPKLESN